MGRESIMPGRPCRWLVVGSSLLFLYAALPTPRSAVWRNHEGSFDPRADAISSRVLSGDASFFKYDALFSAATIDKGLLVPPLDCGRCCHFIEPERVGIAALGEDRAAVVGDDGDNGGIVVADRGRSSMATGLLLFLAEPKPLKSGTDSIPMGLPCCAIGDVEARFDDEGL